MKIYKVIIYKNGTIQYVTDVGNYAIAKNADNNQPYGICLPKTNAFVSLEKGKGKKAYAKLKTEINKNYHIPITFKQ